MLRRPLASLVVISLLVLLTPANSSAQSPLPTPPKGKGQILVKFLDAEGKALDFKGNVFFSVYPARQEGSTIAKVGSEVICSETRDYSRLFPERPFCVPPGKYLLEQGWMSGYRDFAGYPLPVEQRFFAVAEGQTVTRTVSLSQVQVTVKNHENKFLPNLDFYLRDVIVDANGTAFPGETILGHFGTGDFGKASITLTPGKYFIVPPRTTRDPAPPATWFFKDHVGVTEVSYGQKVVIDLMTSRLDYVPRNPDGSLMGRGTVVVYKPKVNANGEPLEPNWVLYSFSEGPHNAIGSTGFAPFDILPGVYSVMYYLDQPRRQTTFEHNVGVGAGIRLLVSNLKDWDIPNGHYYTQTGQNLGGFRVTNEGAIAFWDEFQRLGGADFLGFPVSNRYFFEGTFMQAFQKAILKWDAESGEAKFYPVLEQISLLVGDNWLSRKPVPRPAVFFETEDEALTLLDFYPSIKAKFFANPFGEEQYPYWREHYGYPSGSDEYSAFIALRASNAVFQLWKVDQPGVAKAGEVTLMNVGDLAKEAGIIPKEASTPGPPN